MFENTPLPEHKPCLHLDPPFGANSGTPSMGGRGQAKGGPTNIPTSMIQQMSSQPTNSRDITMSKQLPVVVDNIISNVKMAIILASSTTHMEVVSKWTLTSKLT